MAPSVEAILKHYESDIANVEFISPRRKPAPIHIVEPDPTWPQTFETLKDRILAALGDTALEVNHAGSTSVPGLPAKPVIDVDTVVRDPTDEASYVPQLEAAGFEFHLREPGWHEHRLFVCDEPRVNLHVFGPDAPEVARHQIFRRWLIANGDDRELYAKTKREAAEQSTKAGETMMEYNSRKEKVIQEILERAFRDLGYIS